MKSGISVLILAGGKSTRMGYPKAFLNIGKSVLIENIVDTYRGFTNNIHVTLNHEFATDQWQAYLRRMSNKVNLILNHNPEKGRFYSIKLGLAQITNSDYCFIHNVDNPVTSETIKSLIENKNKDGYSVPAYNHKNGHPILISSKIITGVKKEDDDTLNWKDFLSRYDRCVVETGETSVLKNLNTPSEYEDYLQVNGQYLY